MLTREERKISNIIYKDELNEIKKDSIIGNIGKMTLLVRVKPNNLLCPHHSFNHHILVKANRLELHYMSKLGRDNYFLYKLESPICYASVKIDLNVKDFQRLILGINVGSIIYFSHKKYIDIDHKFIVRYKKLEVESYV